MPSLVNPIRGSLYISQVIPIAQCPDGTGQTLQCDANGNLLISSSAANIPTLDAATGANNATAPLFSIQIATQDVNGKLQAVSPTNPLPTTGGGGGGGVSITNYALETGGNLASIKTNTDKIPSLGQALAASSVPVVLTASQLSTLTPLATVAVTGTFWQATQPVSIASMPSTPVTGTFWQATQPVSGTVAISNASIAVTGTFFQATQPVSIASMPSTPVTGTFWPYSLGQQLAAASVPMVLTAAQITTLTPPAAITNFANETGGNLATIATRTPALGQALAAASVPIVLTSAQLTTLTPPAAFNGVVTNAGTFAVQAVLGAETTKVIGTVNQGTSPWVTSTTLAAETTKVIGTVNQGTSPWVTSTTLAAETVKVIGTVNIASAQTVGLVAGSAVIGHVINDASSAVIGHVIVDTAPSTAVTNAGTFAVQAAAPTLTKGTQGSTGFSVQELKDAGRTYVTMYAQLITGVTTEALATFTKNVNGTATTAQTAYTITSGKTFRIQSLFVRILNTTTVANSITVNVRVAASVAASSPIVFSCGASAPAAVSGVVGVFNADIPDGMEIAGNGTIQIGIGHLENVTTASIASFTLVGYEY